MEDLTGITTRALHYPGREPRNLVGQSARFRGKLANPELEELAKTMTLQVAMIGSDGWVLASDKHLFGLDPTRSGGVTEYDSEMMPGHSKIRFRKEERLIWAFSGNVDVSYQAGIQLQRSAKGISPPDREEALNEIGREVAIEYPSQMESGHGGTLLVISCSPKTDLWTLRIGSGPTPSNSFAFGGAGNRAKFLVERFYERRPVADLKLLAVLTIIEGHHFNPSTVNGLELWYAEKGNITQAKRRELADLKKHAARFNAELRQRLLAPSPKRN